jgi:peptide/nickel transport system permease protein
VTHAVEDDENRSPLRCRIVLKHLLPNAASVALSLAGLIVSGLLAGMLTMEVLFNLPGIGMLAWQAIEGRDSPIVQAVILICALSVVAVNAGVDLVLAVIDPRDSDIS